MTTLDETLAEYEARARVVLPPGVSLVGTTAEDAFNFGLAVGHAESDRTRLVAALRYATTERILDCTGAWVNPPGYLDAILSLLSGEPPAASGPTQ